VRPAETTAAATQATALSGLPPDVRDRVLMAAGRALTVSDARAPDHPLVWVNPAFERSTGYALNEAVGRNCRFLQSRDTDPAVVREIADALRAQQPVEVTLLNVRADGSPFWNELSIAPVPDAAGVVTHFVGMQSDVSARVLAERSRAQHRTAERAAALEQERSRRRLEVLAEATSLLASTLDVDESLERLSDLVVPELADWCLVNLTEDDGSVRRAGRHRDADMAPLLQRLEGFQAGDLPPDSPAGQVLAGAGPLLMAAVTDEQLRAANITQELYEASRALGVGSVIVVPLAARSSILGTMTLVRRPGEPPYEETDLGIAADLGRRAALTLDNARMYTREHEVAGALQRSLLPVVLPVDGVRTATRYLPGTQTSQIGGDWYDVFALPDGAVGMAIGDVMGHDLAAAAAMGQLRSVLRSYAWKGTSPAEVLDSLDELVQGLEMAQLATAVYARLEFVELRRPGRRLTDPPPAIELPQAPLGTPALRYANAGHLPPLLRGDDGTVRALEGGRSVLVGAPRAGRRVEAVEAVPAGSTLLFYTDGLIEQRRLPIDEGLQRLIEATANGPVDVDALCDHVLERMHDHDHDDDIAILAVTVEAPVG